jgi:hypothetical protein
MSAQILLSIGVAVLPIAAPFLAALYKLLISRLPAAQAAQVQAVISSAVSAAEKVYAMAPGSGQAKRQFVVDRVEAIFGKRVNPALVEILLEDAVRLLPPSKV